MKMWHFKTRIIVIAIGALGTIKKYTDMHINMIPSRPCLQEIVL